jgi:hypothetical protein
MSRPPHKQGPLVICALGGLIGVMLFCISFLTTAPRTATGVIRRETVSGNGNRLYHRLVRVERAGDTITTTVTFTDLASGGVGRAVYSQPELRPDPRWQRLVRRVRVMLGLPVIVPWEAPVMVIPYPMKPGEKWIVRIYFHQTGAGTEGRGQAPKGAALDHIPSIHNPWLNPLVARDSSIIYGERLHVDR